MHLSHKLRHFVTPQRARLPTLGLAYKDGLEAIKLANDGSSALALSFPDEPERFVRSSRSLRKLGTEPHRKAWINGHVSTSLLEGERDKSRQLPDARGVKYVTILRSPTQMYRHFWAVGPNTRCNADRKRRLRASGHPHVRKRRLTRPDNGCRTQHRGHGHASRHDDDFRSRSVA